MEYKDIEKAVKAMKTIPLERKSKKTGEVTRTEYPPVTEKVKAFRSVCPNGTIETRAVTLNKDECVFEAYVKDGDIVLGTGHAREERQSSFINQTSYIENCETSAVGRALGMLGLGSEASIASAEEVATAIMQQKEAENQEEPVPDKLEPKAENADRKQVVDAVLRQTGITKGTFNAIYGAFCKNVLKSNGTILLSNLDDNTFADAILYINEQLKKGVA